MPRALAVVVFLMVGLVPASAAATDSGDQDDASIATTTTIDNSFLDTERDLTDCLNNSLEQAGCGRVPTNEGDRGGALQLVTFIVMGLGIGVISWRVARAVRARDAALGSRPS